MEELFDKLISSFWIYWDTANSFIPVDCEEGEKQQDRLLKLKSDAQDNLNDYIDKRIELANRNH